MGLSVTASNRMHSSSPLLLVGVERILTSTMTVSMTDRTIPPFLCGYTVQISDFRSERDPLLLPTHLSPPSSAMTTFCLF